MTVIEGGAPDGSNLVKTDYNLPINASVKEIAKAIKNTVQARFQGKTYRIGNTNIEAKITKRTRNELEFKQSRMSKAEFVRKGSMAGNYDELLQNMTDVRLVENYKPETKPEVDFYMSGRVAVDLGDGKIYHPRIDVEIGKNGKAIGYDIADIKEFPRSKPQGLLSRVTNPR